MAEFTVNPQRFDPYKNFKFLVLWDGRVVAGATREVGSGFIPKTSAVGVHEVLGEALRVAPGLAEAEIGEIRVGLRPRTLDNLPVLGGVPTMRVACTRSWRQSTASLGSNTRLRSPSSISSSPNGSATVPIAAKFTPCTP